MATRKTAVAAKKPAPRKPKAVAPPLTTTVVARYDAAGMGRRMKGWNPPTSGPNRAIEGLQKLRDRSRDSTRNDWAPKSGVQHWTTNLIGTGIVPRMPRRVAKEVKTRLNELWTNWVKVCDADGVLNFYGLQTLITKAWLRDGEVFIRLRPRRIDSGMEVPFQIQVIESDFVPLLDADNWPGMAAGNTIRSGVERNRMGQKVAYWVYKEHPTDNKGSNINARDLIRVAKSQMLHVFEPERGGQLRGVPDFSPILARLRNILDFDDAVLERQKIANLFAMFVEKSPTGNFDPGVDPLTGKPIVVDTSGVPMVGLEPGLAQELLPGDKATFSNPPEAGTTYAEYIRTQHLGSAAGMGLPYEMMSGDIKDVSDRTLRVVINEFRRYAEQRQWQIIIPQACQPIREFWVEQGALVGVIAVSEVKDAMSVEWAPQGWPYIHPEQDVNAKGKEVEFGFRSRSSVISERGDDPEQVDEERKADDDREDKLGLKPEPVVDPMQQQQTQTAISGLTQTVARLETAVNTRPTPQPPQPISIHNTMPAVNVTNELPAPEIKVEAPQVSVQNAVPAPIVNVVNEVAVPTVAVEVAAPAVSVTNNVQPAEVTVNLPDRETTSVIERDREGNIVNVTQTEKTLQ